MSFDFHTRARGEVFLLDQFGRLDNDRSRYSYSTVTTGVSHQNMASTALITISQTSRQSPSPSSSWVHVDVAGDMGGPFSMHSPNSASGSASSPKERHASPPGYQSSSSSPLQQQPPAFQTPAQSHSSTLLTDWTLQRQAQHYPNAADLSQYIQDPSFMSFNAFATGFAPPPLEYMATSLPPCISAATLATTQAALSASMQPFSTMSPIDDRSMALQWTGFGIANWQDFEPSLAAFPVDNLSRVQPTIGSHSPSGSHIEVLSSISGSDKDWSAVNVQTNYESYQQQAQQAQNAAIFNPSQTLHLRTNSDSSHSDIKPVDISSYDGTPWPYSPYSSDGSDTSADAVANHRHCFGSVHHQPQQHHLQHQLQQQLQQCQVLQIQHQHQHSDQHAHKHISSAATVVPIAIRAPQMTSRPVPATGSGFSSTSPPARRNSGPRKSPTIKATKAVIRRTSNKKESTVEKKVGRRRGPLLPEQRKQASEIRKLRACLRCKFLKKTCDKGEPCAGCQPSHARLWQVPCSRIDIKEIGYFLKDWKVDYERHLDRNVSVFNVKGFGQEERLMWITHGYGFVLPVMVREVFVADEKCFHVDWVESCLNDQNPIEYEIRTERLDVGHEGVSPSALSKYLDQHIDGPFENFIDDHFEGTPFITEILKTAHRYYMKEKLPVIRKALKLILAYNLTLHITMIEQPPEELEGKIEDEDSKYFSKTVAPVMVNFQIKCAMADMWRELQRNILEELSALYSSVYSGDRLKNWPTIFMLASILLAMWEEMQFDCHYRVPDPLAVTKFCQDMEQIPVGVIVGLFHAISQKLPAFTEWDSRRHGHLLQNNPAVCEAMTEVRQHVIKHESYLRTRRDTKFDRYDFDSLSNKFLSKLVIRA